MPWIVAVSFPSDHVSFLAETLRRFDYFLCSWKQRGTLWGILLERMFWIAVGPSQPSNASGFVCSKWRKTL